MRVSSKFHILLIIPLLVVLFTQCQVVTSRIIGFYFGSPEHKGAFTYEFKVDNDGNAHVKIIYSSSLSKGSSWVFVPRFINWVNKTIHGSLLSWAIEEPEKYVDSYHYFYKVLSFNFVSDRIGFKIVIEYDFPLAAMIVESESKHGIFYSPQVGFEPGNLFEAIIVFPERFRARTYEAIAFGELGSYKADIRSNSSHIFFKNIPLSERLLRIQIGFDLADDRVNTVVLKNGIFEFITVTRYEKYAQKILNLYNTTYRALANIFNVTLDQVNVRFFVPEFNTLMSIGGYIPFRGGTLGDIYINLIFTRYVEGYLEVIALHELIHHFAWKAGVSPWKLLWFHEGIAQLISTEIADRMGYEGAKMIKREIYESIGNLGLSEKSNLRFLKEWTPYYAPRETGILYASAYYVVSELASENGGLEYYARFFRLLGNKRLENNAMLCYYLSLAANKSLFNKFNSWGFDLPDIYAYWPLIIEVEKAINSVNSINPFLQPFRKIAEILYWAAVSNEASPDITRMLLEVALFIAKNARFTALATYSFISLLAILTLVLRSRR